MKTAYLSMKNCTNNERTGENFKNVGGNTGNIVFGNALRSLFKAETITNDQLKEESYKYNRLIVHSFIWIKENQDVSWFREVMNNFKDKPIIPMSIGIQAPEYDMNFRLHPSTVHVFRELSELSKLGVRGEFTAEILNRHGIKNIQIIGCPSLYMGGYGFRIQKAADVEREEIFSNYRTLSNTINTDAERRILEYLAENSGQYIDQNRCYFSKEVLESLPEIVQNKIIQKKKIFFIFEDWQKYVSRFKFGIGGRFHGNVIALLAGVPTLFWFLVQEQRK